MNFKKPDHEAEMAKAQLAQIARNAMAVYKMINEGDELDGWISSYITEANDHMNSVHEKMAYDQAAADAVESGPRSYEESAQYQVKSGLCEQWLQKKYQGR
jgi:hypothetical protein